MADRDDNCPACGSGDVMVGAFVLSCLACGWNHNNKHPCRVCGQPSFSAAGGSDGDGNSYSLYGCRAHPVTHDEALKASRGMGS